MGCGVGLLRVFLVLVNVVFGLLGALFLAVGIVIKVGSDLYGDEAEEVLDSLPDLAEQVNIGDAEDMPDDGLELDVDEILDPVAIAFMVFGAALLILCIVGCFGACCSFRTCMIVYAVILILIFLAQLVMVALFFTGVTDDQMRSTLNDTIVEDYGGIDSWDHMSLAWNFAMAELECCGLDGYEDFEYATNWKRQRKFNVSGSVKTETLQTPVACCKLKGTFPDVSVKAEDCALLPNDNVSNWKTGCWDAAGDKLEEHENTAIGVCSGILLFEALLVVASLAVYGALRRKDY